MNHNLNLMLKVSEGRYLREAEVTLFREYYSALPQRLELLRELQQLENTCVNATLNALFAELPGMAGMPEARAKAERDMGYLYRSAAQAMAHQDLPRIAEAAGFVFAIFDNLGLPAKSMETAYELLREQLSQRLAASKWEQVRRYYEVLSPSRLSAWRELANQLPALIQAGIGHTLTTWPQLKELPQVETHMAKDMQALLQAAGLAMLSRSPQPVEEIKAWLYVYFQTLRFDMQMVYDTYRALPELSKPLLSADTHAALTPWLESLQQAPAGVSA